MNCRSCGRENESGTRFCVQCASPLLWTCGHCQATLPEDARFCPQCGHPVEERETGMRKLLGIPDNVIPFSLIALGHPAEQKGRDDRYQASRVRRNGW